jgi:hypothetical protein
VREMMRQEGRHDGRVAEQLRQSHPRSACRHSLAASMRVRSAGGRFSLPPSTPAG